MEKEEKQVFAKGFCFEKIFLVFILGCIIGTVYEQILMLVRDNVWTSRQGVIYGPFNPVYGCGVAIFVIFLGKNFKTRNIFLTFFYCCLIGGITEFLMSYFQELFFHTKSWDYTGYFLSIGGRTTVLFMLLWGTGGIAILKYVYPLLSNIIEKMPYSFAKTIYKFLLVFMTLNMLISFIAVARQNQRYIGIEAKTALR